VRRKKRRAEEGAGEAAREKQIWITGRHGRRVFDGLEAAALYASREAGTPISGRQILSALKLGSSVRFCGIAYSYEKPEPEREERAPLLRRNALDGGIRRIH
jgi:hypothetical protein